MAQHIKCGSDRDFGPRGHGPGGSFIPDTEKVESQLEWVCHPARHRKVTAVLVTLLVLVLCGAVYLAFNDPVLTTVSVVVLGVTLSPFYLPTRFSMTEDAITIRTLFGHREKPWDRYRRYQADRHGVLLSPFDRPSRLDRFHGLNLRFDAGDRTRVLEFIKARFNRE